ncbi:MAG TPA: RICIN domain-containing protein [Phycisphaerae bacterium]|nr:RICIN domain-containing protein [Phycisphaerae bacterium]
MPFLSQSRKNRNLIPRSKKSTRRLLIRPAMEALEPRLMLSSLTPGYTYALVNSHSNLAADVPSGMDITGIVVVQYNWSGRNEQEWKLTSVGSGHYEIINVASGEALGVTGAATTSGATVDQETYAGNTSQQWSLTSAGGGAYLITNVNSGLNLDVTSTSAYGGYGAQLIQATASGGASQDWKLQGLAPGWTDQDIGSPGVAGSANYAAIYNGTTWNVTGGGADIYGTSDQFNFASQSFTGDGQIVAKVTSQTNTNASAKAGVMFRNTNAANSAFADVVITPSSGVEFQWRSTAGGASYSASISGIKTSVWVKLVRSGNQFSGYYSTGGNTWTQIGSTQTITMNSTLLAGLAVTAHNNSSASTAAFSWVSLGNQPVYVNSNGQLAFNPLPNGDQAMDFSTAGYEEGNMPIPTNITVEATVNPSGDATGATDTTNIQNAINAVSALPLVDGIRGAVLLEPGEFYVSGTLNITASGVVLEGSGDSGYSSGGTTIQMINDVQNLIQVSGGTSLSGVSGTKENITESYVPTGTDTLTVASAAPYQVGDQIEIVDPITAAFIQYMGMDELYRNGAQQTWISAGSNLITERTITAIDGNQITLDAPMSTSINANLQPGAYVEEYTSTAISQVGIQNMQLLAAAQEPTDSAGDAAINMNGVTNAWVQDMNMINMISDVGIGGNCSKITVQNITSNHTGEVSGDSLPADFTVGDGPTTQILFDNITDNADKVWYFTSYDLTAGPIVVENSTFTGTGGALEPHMRWSTGLLIDDVSVPNSGIDIFNRETDGSGHGWTIGSGVVWNSSATSLTVQSPPGTEVWVVGSTGTEDTTGGPVQPPGIIYSQGVPISNIPSLYEAQLAQRLAENALPTGWTGQDIGGPETIGSSSYNHNTGVWTINGDGTDIAGTSDQFQFASGSVAGNAVISAEVDSQINTNSSAKAGVMFRNSNAANDLFADVVVKPAGGGLEFQWRSTVGGSASATSVSIGNEPVWVRLVRSGNNFSAYYSTNGTTWTQIGTAETINMSSAILGGLAVSSHDNGVLSTATFTNVDVLNVATAAAAATNPVTGKTTNLSVQGADSGSANAGASAISYTWSVSTKPNGATTPTFSVNGTNAAENTTATFYQAGAYTFLVTMNDTAGNSTTSSVNVTVNQTLTNITVSPNNQTININTNEQFTATGYDQFGVALAAQPTFTWSVISGGGTVNSSGLYTAPGANTTATVQAASGAIAGTATVKVNTAIAITQAAMASPSPVNGTSTNLSVQGSDSDGQGNGAIAYTWSVTSEPNGATTPTFSVNGTNAAQNTTATFYQAGNYTFLATLSDSEGNLNTSSVNVTVNQTLTSIGVSPSNPTININATQQFSAVADDQFGMAMVNQPAFTWSVISGGGMVNASGLYTAPNSAGAATVQAASGAIDGSTNVTIFNPMPPTLLAAVSNKQQGSNVYGINLALNGTPTVEDRIDGPTDMVLTFNTAVVLGPDFSLSLSSGTGNAVANGDTITITMSTDATNGQTLVVGLNDVADANTGGSSNYSFDAGVLLGDVFGSGTVTLSDLSIVQSNLNQTVNAENFTQDVGCAGSIVLSDLGLVQSNLNNTVAPPPPSGGPLEDAAITQTTGTSTGPTTLSNGPIATGTTTNTTENDKPTSDSKVKTQNTTTHTHVAANTNENNLNNTPFENALDTGDASPLGKNLFTKLFGWWKS